MGQKKNLNLALFTGPNSLWDSLNLAGEKQKIYSMCKCAIEQTAQWWDMKWNICNLFVLNYWWLSNFIISNIKLELCVQNPDLLSQHDWGRVFLELFHCMFKKKCFLIMLGILLHTFVPHPLKIKEIESSKPCRWLDKNVGAYWYLAKILHLSDTLCESDTERMQNRFKWLICQPSICFEIPNRNILLCLPTCGLADFPFCLQESGVFFLDLWQVCEAGWSNGCYLLTQYLLFFQLFLSL